VPSTPDQITHLLLITNRSL